MASRELVGRPLVPFFDGDDNVNDTLQVAEADNVHEDMEVDARVWNKELGYFEYPSEQQASAPVAIGAATSGPNGGDNKLLLTPAMMLSSSCPEQSSDSLAANGSPTKATDDSLASARSNSAKRGSRQQKNRSNTPSRRRGGKQSDDTPAAPSTGKRGKSKGGNNGHKQKDELSASGKWAWSAFQSSPDPKDLPLPPFLMKPKANGVTSSMPPGLAPSLPPTPPVGALAPPLPPPLPPGEPVTMQQTPQRPPPMPAAPPEAASHSPGAIEVSMTQDLRRMLNIGGG